MIALVITFCIYLLIGVSITSVGVTRYLARRASQ